MKRLFYMASDLALMGSYKETLEKNFGPKQYRMNRCKPLQGAYSCGVDKFV